MRRSKYFSIVNPFSKVSSRILHVNPTVPPQRTGHGKTTITAYSYDAGQVEVLDLNSISECEALRDSGRKLWLNIDGIRQQDVEECSRIFGIHSLLAEDIMSMGQRPKMDEMGDLVYVLLYMMYFNTETKMVETEQVSVVLGTNWVITFQEDNKKDVFNPVRDKMKIASSKVRQYDSDYLFYTLLDGIVDNYFITMDRLGEHIEELEEEIIQHANTVTLSRINFLRKEMILLKRNISPVREIIGGIMRSESVLINERTEKYFKDVYDHIIQANELSENYRDMMLNLHDLYLSELNLKMNEVMKVMAVVTCLLAPATVIGGIFGMNFTTMPWLHNHFGFWMAVGFMLLIPVWMIWIFRRRGWF